MVFSDHFYVGLLLNFFKQPPKIPNLYNLGQTIEVKFDFN